MDDTQVRGRARAALTAAVLLVLTAVALALPGRAMATEARVPADGTYQMQARMMNAGNHYQESMADAAVVKPVEVSVSGGACTAHLTMQPIQRKLGTVDFTGYLRYLRYWDGTAYRDVTVDSYYDAVDTYNDAGDGTASYRYPENVEFPLVNGTAGDDAEGFVHLQVFVPVMAAINPDSGTQPVLLQLDWPARHEASLTVLREAVSDAESRLSSGSWTAEQRTSLSSAIEMARRVEAAADAGFWDYDDAAEALAKAVSDAGEPGGGKGTAAKKAATVGGITYRLSGKSAVAAKGAKSLKKATVRATVRIGGKAYKVMGIKAGAFKGCKKLKSVTVGKNVKSIGGSAFSGCKKLKTVTVKTKKLARKSVKGSLKGSKVKTVEVKVGGKKANEKYAKKYAKIFTKKVAGKKVAVTAAK